MAITMNMSGYEIEREDDATEEYGDEVMCAEWNPQLALIHAELGVPDATHTAFTRELADLDVDTFLKKMYEYQQ